MCFSDLVTTNRQPSTRLTAHVSQARGTERLERLEGGMNSLTAHVGNWELAGRLLALRSARPTHVVVAEEEVRALKRWVRRDGEGVRFVPAPRPPSRSSWSPRSVEERSWRCRETARWEPAGMPGPVFGRPAPFPLGPFILARALRVPLVPAFCMLDSDRRYEVTVPEPLTVAAGGEEDALRTWVALLEDTVRRHPTQWFDFFDVWNPSPGNAKSLDVESEKVLDAIKTLLVERLKFDPPGRPTSACIRRCPRGSRVRWDSTRWTSSSWRWGSRSAVGS